MPNPFQQRATDRYRDAEAFLSIVTPGPIVDHLRRPAEAGRLYDRLVVVTGTPGSGKTTMAKLIQLDVIDVLLRNQSSDNRETLASLAECKLLEGGTPSIAAVRIPMESEYRECWELPYSAEIKNQLLLKLIQARTMLAWLRALRSNGRSCQMIPKTGSEASMETIGGSEVDSVELLASEIELAVYKIVSALVPPSLEDLPTVVRGAYKPFDILEAFERIEADGQRYRLTPLVLLDDAHSLHPEQLAAMMRELIKRELRIGRWVLMRLDALTFADVLRPDSAAADAQQLPGTQLHRDATVIPFQGGLTAEEQKPVRKSFERSAIQMANKYLARMPAFQQRGIRNISQILDTDPDDLLKKDMEHLRDRVDAAQERLGVPPRARQELEQSICEYAVRRPDRDIGVDVQLAALHILMHRYQKRNPQQTLFMPTSEQTENIPAISMGVVHGARLQLMHWYDRPYYFGFDAVRDASSENAELFLHFAGHLVEHSEVRLIRGSDASLSARIQHDRLRAKAGELIKEWNFPYHREVRSLTLKLAERCREKSLLPNAPLDGGASAFGVPQQEIDTVSERLPKLARVLHFGFAYKALQLTQHYKQGDKGSPPWCLIEIGGFVRVAHGLTHHRGGFIESSLEELEKMHAESIEKVP